MSQLLKDLFLLFFPQLCLGCHKEIISSLNPLCYQCELDLPLTYMPITKDPFYFNRTAYNWSSFQMAFSLYFFKENSLIETLLYSSKYGGNKKIGLFLGQKLGCSVSEAGLHFEGIIGVPLHPIRRIKRGYNQVDLIGNAAAIVLSIPYYPKVFRRKKNTPALSKTTRSRKKLMADAFKLNKKVRLPKGHYLLIDDIFTTGATLNSCLHLLQKEEGISLSIGVIACRN